MVVVASTRTPGKRSTLGAGTPLRLLVLSCFWMAVIGIPGLVSAQDGVGRRIFSDQLVISEPFVEDELTLPSILHIRLVGSQLSFPALLHLQQPRPAGEPRALFTQLDGELKKRLTPNLEGSISGGLTLLDPDDRSLLVGTNNLALGLKYQFLRSPAQEAVASVALDWEVGGTGRGATGAEPFDTLSPALLVGKGFGDLPDALAGLKPLALSGLFGARIPTRASTRAIQGDNIVIEQHPDLLTWGIVMEYSVPYLQSYVRHLGLPMPLDRMVPLAELDFQTAVDRGQAGKTFGTANVGLVWVGKRVQIGVEAVLPVNDRSGKNLGGRAFLRIGLDGVFGGRWGRPVFGGSD